MGTDSPYAAYGAKGGLDDCVRTKFLDEFYNVYRDFFPAPVYDDHWQDYIQLKTTVIGTETTFMCETDKAVGLVLF